MNLGEPSFDYIDDLLWFLNMDSSDISKRDYSFFDSQEKEALGEYNPIISFDFQSILRSYFEEFEITGKNISILNKNQENSLMLGYDNDACYLFYYMINSFSDNYIEVVNNGATKISLSQKTLGLDFKYVDDETIRFASNSNLYLFKPKVEECTNDEGYFDHCYFLMTKYMDLVNGNK